MKNEIEEECLCTKPGAPRSSRNAAASRHPPSKKLETRPTDACQKWEVTGVFLTIRKDDIPVPRIFCTCYDERG